MKTRIIAALISVILLGSVQSIMAQDPSVKDEPKYGEDSALCVQNLSVYTEYYKQDLYKDAYLPWKYAMMHCPKASKNLFIRGITLVEEKMKRTEDKAVKAKLVDTLLMVYDRRIKYRGEKGDVLGKKAMDIIKYKNDFKTALEIFDESIELEGNNTHYNVLYYYLLSVIKQVKKGQLEKVKIVEAYDKLSAIAEWNIENNASKKKNYKAIAGSLEQMASPYMTCEDLINMFTPKFETTPDDIELLKKMTSLLEKQGCEKEDLYYEGTKQLIKLEPTAETALLAGNMSVSRENWNNAIQYLEQAAELFTGKQAENPDENYDKELAKAYYLLTVAYKEKGSYLTARSYAYKNLELEPDNGRVYILIGLMYASSAGSCGEGPVHSKSAYWAAVDKFYKAKAVDESVAGEANNLIAGYSGKFPKDEDIFFYNLDIGGSYKVECWINETTTVRKR